MPRKPLDGRRRRAMLAGDREPGADRDGAEGAVEGSTLLTPHPTCAIRGFGRRLGWGVRHTSASRSGNDCVTSHQSPGASSVTASREAQEISCPSARLGLMAALDDILDSEIACRCGCERRYRVCSGLMRYGDEGRVAFRLAHFDEAQGTRHLWLLLGSGAWFEDDARGCWLVLDSWVAEDRLIGRVTDANDSPFQSADIFDERFLTREEVLSRSGALEWAIARRDELIELHPDTRRFVLDRTGDPDADRDRRTDA